MTIDRRAMHVRESAKTIQAEIKIAYRQPAHLEIPESSANSQVTTALQINFIRKSNRVKLCRKYTTKRTFWNDVIFSGESNLTEMGMVVIGPTSKT